MAIEDTQVNTYLTFTSDNEEYGIEIIHVLEIINIQSITFVPQMPHYIKGIINLRGQIIPVIDIRLRFGKMECDYDERSCIIVISIRDNTIGVIVDSVAEVMDILEEDIVPPPPAAQTFNSKYISGIGRSDDKVKLLLDCDKLLHDGI